MLPKANILFDTFDQENITYCHWKSNEHLRAGLNGETDLDILVKRSDSAQATQVLKTLKFQRCNTVEYLNYNSVEDFVGLDEDSGKLLHVHLHYELVLGKKFLKSYHLPIEDQILSSRKVDESTGVYIIQPDFEIILLIIRRALKRNWLSKYTFWRRNIFPEEEEVELSWLLEEANYSSLKEISRGLIDEEFANSVIVFLSKFPEDDYQNSFNVIQKTIKKNFQKFRSYSPFRGFLARNLKIARVFFNYTRAKFLDQPHPFKRSLNEGGIIVAFIGTDGAGKSKIIKELQNDLSWKFDVQKIYFGSGDGKSSLLRFPLKLLLNMKKYFSKLNKDNNNEFDNEKHSFLYHIMKSLWAMTLAWEKKKKFKKMWSARNRGMVVLCDRFPQNQFSGFNDGPLLEKWGDSKLKIKRKISEWEYSIYSLSKGLSPDVVFKLKVEPEVALKRTKGISLHQIKEKKEVIDKLSFTNSDVYVVDTGKPVESSLIEVKEKIWRYINGQKEDDGHN